MIEKLQIYRDSYNLTGKIYASMPEMERMHRFTIGSKMLDASLDMFKWIILANNTRIKDERLKYLDEFISNFEKLRVFLRICSDFKLIKMNTLADLFILTDSISKQTNGWRNATTRM